MKKIFLTYCLLFIAYSLQAQFNNNYWVVGRNCALDFRNGPCVPCIVDSTDYTNPLILPKGCTQVCDRNGNLLFYSNSYLVYNRLFQQMPNGSNFNHGTMANAAITAYGPYPIHNGAVIVPFVKDTNLFYMFYENAEYSDNGSGLPDRLQYLVVDKRLDGGLGDVVFKDSAIIKGDSLMAGNVYAIKHGNGKDWWIIARKFHSNQFYMILVDSAGPHQPIIQHLGTPYMKNKIYHCDCHASMDGSKLSYLYNVSGTTYTQPSQLDIYDFDRCTGALSNYNYILLSHPGNPQDTFPAVSSVFSLNNRFIYVHNMVRLYQLDLQNPNIYDSKINVGDWDHTQFPSNTIFWKMVNAPDGKIYVSTNGSTPYMHVINYPNLLDTFCNFKQKQIMFGTLGYYGSGANSTTAHFSDGGLPNVPNYALGKITCNVGIEEQLVNNKKQLTIYPNPTNDKLIVENLSTGKNEIFITNLLGEEMQHLFANNTKTEIDASCFANGIYFLKLTDEKGNVITKKFVKEN